MRELDRIDEKILAVLTRDNLLTNAQLAERVSTSPSSCRRRVAALRRTGVIAADVSVVNANLLGRRQVVVVLVTLDRDTPDAHRTFRRLITDAPQVSQCFYVTGACDYVVELSLTSIDEYDAFAERYFTGSITVKRVETLVNLKLIKSRIAPLEARFDISEADVSIKNG